MRLSKILSAVGVAACLAAVVPATADAKSPYSRMRTVRHHAEMRHHHHMMQRHHMMMPHHRPMHGMLGHHRRMMRDGM